MEKCKELIRRVTVAWYCHSYKERQDSLSVNKNSSLYTTMLFCLLFISTNFVNKYVLSVLKFTYPTIFQGWQTFVGAVVLKMLIVLGYVGPLLRGIDRYSVAPWMPGMMLFLVSIYAGSRALANLPIPVYFCMQNTVLLFKVVIQIFGNKKLLSICSYMMLMVTAMSSVAISITDPQFSADGYFWMAINILSRGFFHVYSHLIRNRLESLDRLYCCYIYSVLMLAPCSYLLGDALEAVNYPYLYFTKFYLGCIFSGVLGIFLNLTAIQLQKSDSLPGGLDFSGVQAISRILGSIISFFIFPTTLTANFAFLLAVNQLCSVVVSDAIVWHPLPTVIPSSISSKSSASLPDMEQLEQNKFQKDMLRVELE